eukprot:scaffold6233_cov35-Attheya_sp.AAC.2
MPSPYTSGRILILALTGFLEEDLRAFLRRGRTGSLAVSPWDASNDDDDDDDDHTYIISYIVILSFRRTRFKKSQRKKTKLSCL